MIGPGRAQSETVGLPAEHSIRQPGPEMRSLGALGSGCCVCSCSGFQDRGRTTEEDHDTTTLSRDEGRREWFYPEKPLELGGQFISPTGQFSPEPASPREKRTADKTGTEYLGQSTEDRGQARDVTQSRRVHLGRLDYNVSCADDAPFCRVRSVSQSVSHPASPACSGVRCTIDALSSPVP